jgi:SAM-dependent methyltransferase
LVLVFLVGCEKGVVTATTMTFESLMTKLRTLNSSVEELTAIGAELRLRQEELNGDPRVRSLLQEVVHHIDPELLDGLDANQERAALALIQTSFRQALDLLENPARTPGWNYQDPVILESQGQISRLTFRGIDTLAAQRPDLAAALRQPGAFLDVGTGVGWIAIEAAHSWPAQRVVAIDSWEPALALARKNLSLSGLTERVELRSQGVEDLDDKETFTLAWLPGPFIPADIVAIALERIHRALVPGGWLIFGLNPGPPSALGEALTNLRIVRGGGHPWTTKEAEERLGAHGFERIEAWSPFPSIMFVLGQRPAISDSI